MAHTLEQLIAYNYRLSPEYGAIVNNLEKQYPILQPNLPLPKQYLGVEIEVENVPRPRKISDAVDDTLYTITNDGSLRNYGIEIITKPIQAQYIEQLLKHLYAALPERAEFSPRTSIHVHMNARDLTCEQLASLISCYIIVEKLLYYWIGTNRHKSIFCVPIQDTNLPINLESFLTTHNIRHLFWFKYTGMNLLPLKQQGSIEFRQLHGTRDPDLIVSWISLLQCLFKYAVETDSEKVTSQILLLNTTSDYFQFLEGIFKEKTKLLIYQVFCREWRIWRPCQLVLW